MNVTKVLFTLLFAANLSTTCLSAANRWWDGGTANLTGTGNGTSAGGAGTWSTGITNWDAGSGLAYTNWVNANNDTANFGGTAGTVTLGTAVTANALTFGTNGYTLTGGTLTLAGATPTLTAGTNVTINSVLAGTAGLTKAGAGAVTLGGANTFTGGWTVTGGPTALYSATTGALVPGSAAALGGNALTFTVAGINGLYLGSTMTITNNMAFPNASGTLFFVGATSGSTETYGGVLSGGGSSFILGFSGNGSGASTVTELTNAANTFQGTIDMERGILGITSAGALGNTNNIIELDQGASTSQFRFDGNNIVVPQKIEQVDTVYYNVNGNNATLSGPLTGSDATGVQGGTLTGGNSAGSLTISGSNTGGSPYVVAANTKLIAASTNALGTGSVTVSSGGTVAFGNIGTYAGTGPLTLNGTGCQTNGTGVGALQNLAGTNVFNNVITNASASAIGVTAGSLTLGGVITGSGSLTKIGPGTLNLTGNNTYTGATLVGAGTLNGAGILPGSVTVSNGCTLSAANGSAFTNGSLTLGTTGTDAVTLVCSGNGSAVSGYFAVTGANGFTNNAAVTVVITGSLPTTPGTNTLIAYAGTLHGAGSFVLAPLPNRAVGYLITNTSLPALQLVVTALDSDVWTGSPANNWDLAGTNDWRLLSSGLPTAFQNTDRVVFDDSASNFTVNADAIVSPGGVTFSNNANSYTLAGPSAIAGSGGVTLQGAGTVTLATTNTYTGATTVNAGTLVLGTAAAIPAAAVVNGTLDVAGTSPVITSLSGTGTVDNVSAGGAPVLTVANPAAATFAGTLQNSSGLLGLTVAGSATFSLTGSNTYSGGTIITSGTLQVGTGGTAGTLGVGSVLDNATLAFNRADVLAVPNPITGTGGLQQNGSGTVNLEGALSCTGPTTVNAGVLAFQNIVTFDAYAGYPLTIATGASAQSAATLNLNANASGTAIDVTGNGTLQLTSIINEEDKQPDIFFGDNQSGTSDYGVRLAAPLNLGSSTARTIYGLSGRNDVARYNLTGCDCQFAGSISGSAELILDGQNSWTGVNVMEVPFAFNASNSFTGPLVIERGSVYLGNANALTAGNVLNCQPAANMNAHFFLYGFNAAVADLQSSGAGGVVIADGNNVTTTNVGPATLTVTQNNPFTFGGNLCDWYTEYVAPATGSKTPVLSLVKNGAAALTLTGSNTYSGTTVINAGKLYVNNVSLGGGAFLVGAGATLGGSGVIGSIVTVSNGAAIETGAGNATGNLTLAALTLGGTGTDTSMLNVGLAALLAVTNSGGLVINSGTGSVTVNVSGTPAATGQYPLITYGGSLGGTGFAALQLGALPAGVLGYLSNVTAQSAVDLVVTRVTVPRWTGALSSQWSTNVLTAPKNWVLNSDGVTTVDYADGENVRFDDTATTTTVTVSGTNVAPTSVVFSNSAKNYSLSGTGGITGGTSLTKQGTGTVTLGLTNSYTGNTTVSGGTLALGTAAALPGGGTAGNLTLNGTLDVAGFSPTLNNLSGSGTVDDLTAAGTPVVTLNETTNTTFTGPVKNTAGTLSVLLTGGGTLTLTASNTYAGTTTVSNGTLTVNGSLGTGAVTVQGGAALGGTGTLHGAGTLAGGAALNLTANTPLTIAALTLNGSVTVNVSGAVSTTNAATYVLLNHGTRSGSGTFVLTPVGGLLSSGFAATLNDTNSQLLLVIAPATVTGTLQDVRHVVIFMQENRSFDHYFGTLHGVHGFSDRNPLMLTNGVSDLYQPSGSSYELPFHTTTTCLNDLAHDWTSTHEALNNGNWNQWVAAKGAETMGYYERSDLPYYYALADAYTVCDEYHCSTLTSTDPNRLYLWSGMIDPTDTGGGPVTGNSEPTPGWRWETYPEMLQNAGVSWKVYQMSDNYDDNALAWFANFQGLSAGNPLYDRGIATVTNLVTGFKADVTNGTLPSVSWIVANTTSSEHPPYSPESGEYLTQQLLNALAANPQAYNSTVFVILYDENDGFYDHAVPIVPPAGTAAEFVGGAPIGLGVRVPMILVSPWSRGGYVDSQVFDATSVTRFLEDWTGVKNPNISAWRRQVCGDLTSAFNFAQPNTNYPSLTGVSAISCSSGSTPSVPSPQVVPVQESGTLTARPLPYQPNTASLADCTGGNFDITLTNAGAASVHFAIYANAGRTDGPWPYDVNPTNTATAAFSVLGTGGNYDFTCYGPNGFLRRFAGNVGDSCNALEVTAAYNPISDGLKLVLANATAAPVTFYLTNNYVTNGFASTVPAGTTNTVEYLLATNGSWYDLTATTTNAGGLLRRFAGHLETNADPAVLSSSENASGYRDKVTFTATLTGYGTPAGTVQFETNNVPLGGPVTLTNGTAALATTLLPRGTNAVTAVYSGDLLNAASTNSLSQTVTNHPPVANPALFSRPANLWLPIRISDLLTNATDADGDALTLAAVDAVSTLGAPVFTNGGFVYYDNATNNAADSFAYTVSDGQGGTASSVADINVVSGQNDLPLVSLTPTGSNSLLTFLVLPGYTYVVQRATNLALPVDWLNLSTNTAASNGLFQTQDNFGGLTNLPPAAYYRLLLQQP